MKTIVIDDDPTGTQSASGVRVLLECSERLLVESLVEADSVYVQTNTRAISEIAAVLLLRRIKAEGIAAGKALGSAVQFVLRGDSTLRGHVFAETEVFLGHDSIMLFVPAFPDGGRTTVDGVHYITTGDGTVPANESEFAQDPVFGFRAGALADYVAEKSARIPIPVDLAITRSGGLVVVLMDAPAGSVVVPDATTNDDIRTIAAAVRDALAAGKEVIVRCAAPLAAALAGVESDGLLSFPLIDNPQATLLVCGSHTAGATAQLEQVAQRWGAPLVINTALALADAADAAREVTRRARDELGASMLAVVTTERVRSSQHNTLDHGKRVMDALTRVVQGILPLVDIVISKGGITSADVARIGLGASSAIVLGQIRPGISVWRLIIRDGREILYVVVPGNIGEEDALVEVLAALSLATPPAIPPGG